MSVVRCQSSVVHRLLPNGNPFERSLKRFLPIPLHKRERIPTSQGWWESRLSLAGSKNVLDQAKRNFSYTLYSIDGYHFEIERSLFQETIRVITQVSCHEACPGASVLAYIPISIVSIYII